MKEKDLITFYKIFANLYGAILDKDAFRESFIAEVNNQLGEVKKCLKV